MRAVDAVMECLKAEGVDVVFGLPGGANIPTYDALHDGGIRHVLVRHEAGGGHAAEGYAKATGKVGVCLATSGPGATNVVTPIQDAMMDSVPTVFITGQVRTDLLGTDGFQEADVLGITMPAVKHSFMIQHPLEIPRALHEAFYLARTGRPGPVVVDIPTDLSRADIPYEPINDVRLPGYQPTTEGNTKQIRQAAKALAASRRPVIYAGGGVVNANASAELVELATADRFPITCTLMGLGAFPAPHDQWLGMPGMHGTRTANYAMDEADLICAVGARFDDRVTGKLSEFAPRAKFIHIDIDPAEISKNVPAHIPIVGDAKNILDKLAKEYRALEADSSRLDEWWQRIRAWQERYPLRYEDTTNSEIKPQYMVVACISGDGSFQMNIQELATCAEEGIDVKVFIMNNGYLGMVRQWQELFWDRRYSAVDMGTVPDWVKLAEAYGATGVLARVAGLFARRGFNIGTLAVGPTDDPTLSRITLTVDGALHPIDQVTKQLHKLVNVIKIRDLEPDETVARELALFKVTADGQTRGEIMQLTDIFRGKIVDVTKRTVIVEVTGTHDKVEAF